MGRKYSYSLNTAFAKLFSMLSVNVKFKNPQKPKPDILTMLMGPFNT
jgi:hypothetical protein